MTDLVTADEARVWLRLGPAGDANDDADLADKISQASAIHLQYHNDGEVPEEWLDDSTSPETLTVPEEHKQAVAVILHSLWDKRGENPMGQSYEFQRFLRGPALSGLNDTSST